MSRRDLPRRTSAALVLVLALVAPAFLNVPQTAIVSGAACVALVALGLDVLVGSTGQLSLAHGALFGVGTYTALAMGSRDAPWVVAFAGAVLVTSLAAVVVGLPSLRIRGLQVAIASLAFQQFIQQVPNKWAGVKSAGRTFDPPASLQGIDAQYYLAVGCIAVVLVLLAALRRTHGGRSLLAVRDVEARAAAFGIATGRAKLFAYAVSGGIAGLGGALFALQQTSVSDTQPFILRESLILVAIVVVGGARSPVGILLAALLTKAAPGLLGTDFDTWLGPASQIVPVLLAGLLLLSVVLQPQGIGGVLRDLERLLTGRGEPPSPRPQQTDAVLAAARARALRDVPRPLSQRLPVPVLLTAERVGVRYGGVQALFDLDLQVRRSEIVGLIGANGAGKSTFFNAVSGLAPTSGSIRFRDRELVEHLRRRGRRAGWRAPSRTWDWSGGTPSGRTSCSRRPGSRTTPPPRACWRWARRSARSATCGAARTRRWSCSGCSTWPTSGSGTCPTAPCGSSRSRRPSRRGRTCSFSTRRRRG